MKIIIAISKGIKRLPDGRWKKRYNFWYEKRCQRCREIYITQSVKTSNFCSNYCGHLGKQANWKGGRRIENGYVKIWVKPNCRPQREHRIIMEKFLGRPLSTKEIIHHKNGNKTDNRIENLEIMTQSEHIKHHDPRSWKTRLRN